MKKKAAIILSSPRKGSNSSALALAIGAGVEEAGGAAEVVDLSGLDIKPCLACEACQRNGGKCTQIDGMHAVYPKVAEADILVLSSPVYWFNMSGQLKTFLDRCFAVAMNPDNPFSRKTIAAALSFGDVDMFASGGVNAVRCFQDICHYTGAVWGGCVYGSAMERDTLSKSKELLAKAKEMGVKLLG
ncbi:flavodoxin family protein [Deltaproteobacteria bacterium Smac51]|nr:flavodoxin family protein [Deltaproteobacteria bacterium Smac51]